MDDDYDPNVSGGGSRGSTSLPKFNHLYPILFFSHFIRFCGANKCGGPLSSPDGRIESIVTLEESHAVEEAEMPTPSRASVAADGGYKGARDDAYNKTKLAIREVANPR